MVREFKNLGHKKFEEMKLPPILYKYRDWDNDIHKTILTKSTLYLPPPSDFTDDFDCRVPIRYDLLTDEEIYEWYFNESIKINREYSLSQHKQFAKTWFDKRLLRNPIRIKEFESDFWNRFNLFYGILSLTSVPDNIKMWENYSRNLTGICVGFHTIPLFKLPGVFGGGGEVTYYDELPIIKATDSFEKQSFLQIYSKLEKYKFEKEYRLTKMYNRKDRIVVIPTEIYAEIIIGANIEHSAKQFIKTIISERFPSIIIKQANIKESKVSLDLFNQYL